MAPRLAIGDDDDLPAFVLRFSGGNELISWYDGIVGNVNFAGKVNHLAPSRCARLNHHYTSTRATPPSGENRRNPGFVGDRPRLQLSLGELSRLRHRRD